MVRRAVLPTRGVGEQAALVLEIRRDMDLDQAQAGDARRLVGQSLLVRMEAEIEDVSHAQLAAEARSRVQRNADLTSRASSRIASRSAA